jgi:dihydroorotase
MELLIKGAKIIDPDSKLDMTGDILIKDGYISEIDENIDIPCDRIINASGLTAVPGLVDMHVHLRDPGQTEKEDIISGCRAAAAGGVTSLLCMPNTTPAADNADTVRYILEKAEKADAHVYVAAAATCGLKGQKRTSLSELKEAGATAVSDDGKPVLDSRILKDTLKEADKLKMTFCAHCEDMSLVSDCCINEGEYSRKLGIEGVFNAAEDADTAREIAVAASFELPIHICHVSTSGSAAIIRDAKRRGARVTCETGPHYLMLNDSMLMKKDADYRMNPPLRSEKDRLAMIQAVADGTVDCISTDHAPHTPLQKSDFLKAPNGCIGMETSFSAAYTALVLPGIITTEKLIELMSLNPSRILGINAGKLRKGAPADITLIDLNEKWVVDPERLHGKSKNTPFKGMELTSKVKMTVTGGNPVYSDL